MRPPVIVGEFKQINGQRAGNEVMDRIYRRDYKTSVSAGAFKPVIP
jgi:hypothetical protein